MKKTIYIAYLVFSFILLFAAQPIASQEKEPEKSLDNISPTILKMKNSYPVWGYYIDASPGIASIKINSLSSDVWQSESNFGYNINAGYFHSFSTWAKVKLGIGVSSYDILLTGNGEVQSPQIQDIDKDTYTEFLTVTNGEYNVNPMYLTVPLTFEFGNANINKIGYYIDLGFEYSFLVSEKNTTKVSYTAKGDYPQWGVILEDIPELGFYTDENLESELNLQKSIYSIRGGAGITIPISGVIIFKLGFAGHMGLNNIGKDPSKNKDTTPLSQEAYDFRSTYIYNPLATSKGNNMRQIGIEFGFYICKLVK